jgi:hypothetical protein
MKIEKAQRSDRMMKAVTGVTVAEFKLLLTTFTQLLAEQRMQRKRRRVPGGGRNGKIKSPEQKLFYALFYLKVYPTFDLAALLFDSSKTRTCAWARDTVPLLEKTLGRKLALPERRIGSVEEFLQKFPEVKDLFADGTEREIRRPQAPKQQAKNYSGKSKRHVRKNIVICDENKKIRYLSPTKSGKTHDKTGFLSHVPPDVTIWQDTGFQGTQHTHANTMMPKKKSKNRPLTDQEKEENRIISGLRVVVENAICGVKRYNCLTIPYRNRGGVDDLFINVCAGLWNFHLATR